MKTETPLLVLIFNRPDKVRALIAALLKVKPTHIYVSADGPRAHIETDKTRCQEARDLFKNLPWDCEVLAKFSDSNLGCEANVIGGLDWFFSHVEQGIILEDDCIPDPSFFSYCTELLEHYKDNSRVMHVSGNNFQNGIKRGEASYYFSLYTHSWGWATWRRAWEKFHPAVADMDNYVKEKRVDALPLTKDAKRFWLSNFTSQKHWDSLWLYTVWHEQGVSIIPNQNLVSNIGFGADATHTFSENTQAALPVQAILQIAHPEGVSTNKEADDYTYQKLFHSSLPKRVYFRIRDIISKYL